VLNSKTIKIEAISLQNEMRRPIQFDNTAYLNHSGAETKSFNRIISFEIFQGLLETSSRSTAIDVLGTAALNFEINACNLYIKCNKVKNFFKTLTII
jgi:hypothetical protein